MALFGRWGVFEGKPDSANLGACKVTDYMRNVERLKHRRDLGRIVFACMQIKPDILVLTETDSRLQLDYPLSDLIYC